MKFIINSKRYDSETSTEIASYENAYRSDFSWYLEKLYRTPKGNWWMYGEGNAASLYCTYASSGGSDPGSRAFTMTADQAKVWLERHEEYDSLEKYFGTEIADA